jgi:hydroxymethylpyrimidine/phosphomethylpyrimidine kinase
MLKLRGRVLIVAGSDSGGGAGIQADIKTVSALGAYAMTAVTALTAQDTLGVHGVLPVPPDFVAAQMRCVLDDIGADVVKTGMLGDAATVEAVCGVLQSLPRHLPLVVDPVMAAKGGTRLIDAEATAYLKRRMLPLVSLLTPNLDEAEALAGMRIETEAQMHHAADALLTLGVPAVLLKGGHLPGDEVVDLLATETETLAWRAPRIASHHTHGTGCTLASAVAAGLAQGMSLVDAVLRGRAFVRAAILAAPGFGKGQGPLGHHVTLSARAIEALR